MPGVITSTLPSSLQSIVSLAWEVCTLDMEEDISLLLCVTLVCFVTTVSGQSITITGTSTLVIPMSELRITCQPNSAGISDINSISIQKNTSSVDYATVVDVTYSRASSSSEISWTNTNLQNRQGVSVTGNVDTVAGARLVLVITANNTQCQDEGAYKCLMGVTLTGGSGGGLAEAEKYVAATVSPTYTNALYVTPSPNVNSQYYSVGTVLTFSCSGTVGSDKRLHTWCYKRDDSTTDYTDYPNVSDIDQNEAGLVPDGCNYRRSSTLTYTVTSSDTNTTFMCEPYTGGMCGTSAVGLKSYKSIRNYVPTTTPPAPISTTPVPTTTPPAPIPTTPVSDAHCLQLIPTESNLLLSVGHFHNRKLMPDDCPGKRSPITEELFAHQTNGGSTAGSTAGC